MSDAYKGQTTGDKNGQRKGLDITFTMGGIKSQMIQELKKAISRVPFACDYEARFKFPEMIFNPGKFMAHNPVNDVTPNQGYNTETIAYVEERLPFLTKSVSGWVQDLNTVDASILNRKWSFPTKIDYGEITITFYDMYVQNTGGITEWCSLSEYFKIWIDNIFLNKVDNNTYESYPTVVKYMEDYTIKELKLAQFSRKMEYDDVKFYLPNGVDKVNREFSLSQVDKDKYEWLFNPDTGYALYLAKLQADRTDWTQLSSVIGMAGATIETVNNILNALMTASKIGDLFMHSTEEMDKFKDTNKKAFINLIDGYYEHFNAIKESIVTVPVGEVTIRNNNPASANQTLPPIDRSKPIVVTQQVMATMESFLNEEGFKQVSGKKIQEAIEKAQQDAEPKFFGQDTYIDETIMALSALTAAFELADLTRMLLMIVKPESVLNKTFLNEYGSPLYSNSGIVDAALGSVGGIVEMYNITRFKDRSAKVVLDFLRKNEGLLTDKRKGNPDLLQLPLNFIALAELGNDDRFNKSKIIQDTNNSYDASGTITNSAIKTYIFYDVYPVSLMYNDLSFENDEELTTFNVKFKYSLFEQK